MTSITDPYSHLQRYKFFSKGLGEGLSNMAQSPAPAGLSTASTYTPSGKPTVGPSRGPPNPHGISLCRWYSFAFLKKV